MINTRSSIRIRPAVDPWHGSLSRIKNTPTRLLVSGYFIVTMLFTLLLMLPISSRQNSFQPFIDSFFMACSGISTTGLTVVDIGSHYSIFGQLILMINFQIGGIGYMAFAVILIAFIGKNLSIKNRSIAAESIAGAHDGQIFRFFKRVVIFTILTELVSGLILFVFWLPRFSFFRALYYGFFHSISAFCTAGFCLFSDSMISHKQSVLINVVISMTSMIGGIGFFVISDIIDRIKCAIKNQRTQGLSVHSKLALIMTVMIVLSGTAILLISETWPSTLGMGQKLLDSSFQIISASTTDGFNTMEIGSLAPASLLFLIFLMFTGASPGSTGGGIKTTTLGIILITTWSKLKGKRESNCFYRRIPDELSTKAFVIFQLFISIILVDWFILSITEDQSPLRILFEIASALGNTGLSTGITSQLSGIGKWVLAITMFIGRVGPLTLGLALIEDCRPAHFKNAKAEILVG